MMILGLSIISGIFYRLGGMGNDGYLRLKDRFPWIKPWMFNTKVRDFGVPTVCLGWLYFALGCPWWAYFLSFGIMFGSMTTYWEFWGDEGVEWYEWLLTGFGYGFSLILLAATSGHWAGFIYRCVILAASTCIWSESIGNDNLEEFGRGFLIAITLPLLIGG